MSKDNVNTPKALKSGNGSNFVIPLAIVLIGSLIIFGITKMLQNDRGYKDLVRDLHSKTFGNRWIAAFELSKVISSKNVPKEDIPWLIENLNTLYASAVDTRTKNFIIVALGSLGDSAGVKTIELGLAESDATTKFHSVVALASIKNNESIDFSKLMALLDSDDAGLKQATVLTLSTHKYKAAVDKIASFLNSENIALKYASATGLIYFKDNRCINTVKEVLNLSSTKPHPVFTNDKVWALKLNVLNALKNSDWDEMDDFLRYRVAEEENLKVLSLIKEVLN